MRCKYLYTEEELLENMVNITPKNYRNWYLISGSYKSLRPRDWQMELRGINECLLDKRGHASISLLYWNGLSVVVKICSSEISPSVTFILFTFFSMEIDFVFIIGVKLSQNKELAENAKSASLC